MINILLGALFATTNEQQKPSVLSAGGHAKFTRDVRVVKSFDLEGKLQSEDTTTSTNLDKGCNLALDSQACVKAVKDLC